MTDDTWLKIEALMQDLTSEVRERHRCAWLAKALGGLREILIGNDDAADDDETVEQRARAAAWRHHKQGDDACVVCQDVLRGQVPLCDTCLHTDESDDAEVAYDNETQKLEKDEATRRRAREEADAQERGAELLR